MPASKGRHPHSHHPGHHPQAEPHTANGHGSTVKAGRVTKIAIGFFALFGLVIGYFMSPESMVTFIITTIIGGVAGYYFGHMIEKSLAKK